jgi:tetratricopeptide (TPR) repeat protein
MFPAILAATLMLFGSGCTYLRARDHLNKGIASYRAAKYADAVEHFKQAMELDPDWDTPQVYLATSYMSQWIPGAESQENLEYAAKARAEFLKVLERNPNEETALGYLAMLSYNQATTGQLTPEEKEAKLNEAAEWHKKRIAVRPVKEAYYSLAVIDYQKWSPAWLSARASLRMRSDDPGPLKDKKVREELKAKFTPILEDGIQNLEKALEIDPEYVDAMAYMNLLIRQRADLNDTADVYKTEIASADNWLDKAMSTRKMLAERASKKAAAGIHQE